MPFCNSLSNLLRDDQYRLHAGEASLRPALAGTFQTFQKSSSKGSSKLEQYEIFPLRVSRCLQHLLSEVIEYLYILRTKRICKMKRPDL